MMKRVAFFGLLFQTVSAVILTYSMPASERVCFYTDSKYVEEKMSLYFSVQSGGEFDIDYEITNLDGKIILQGNKEQAGDYVFAAPSIGEFKFCFFNNVASFADKKFDFEILAQHEIPSRNYMKERDLKFDAPGAEDAASAIDVKPVEKSIQEMHSHYSNLIRDLRYFRTRENRNFDTVRSTENRIFWFNMWQNGIIVVTAIVQIVIIQMLFSKSGGGGGLASLSGGYTSVNRNSGGYGGFSGGDDYGSSQGGYGANGSNESLNSGYGASGGYGNNSGAFGNTSNYRGGYSSAGADNSYGASSGNNYGGYSGKSY